MTRIVHKKRGTVYDIVGAATIQCDRPLVDYDTVMIYKDPFSGKLWVRPVHEMDDGRFAEVADDRAAAGNYSDQDDPRTNPYPV